MRTWSLQGEGPRFLFGVVPCRSWGSRQLVLLGGCSLKAKGGLGGGCIVVLFWGYVFRGPTEDHGNLEEGSLRVWHSNGRTL